MSWWGTTKNFGKLASNALKSAQRQIDSVLDISADGGERTPGMHATYLGDIGFDSYLSCDTDGWGGGAVATARTADVTKEPAATTSEKLRNDVSISPKSAEEAEKRKEDTWSWGSVESYLSSRSKPNDKEEPESTISVTEESCITKPIGENVNLKSTISTAETTVTIGITEKINKKQSLDDTCVEPVFAVRDSGAHVEESGEKHEVISDDTDVTELVPCIEEISEKLILEPKVSPEIPMTDIDKTTELEAKVREEKGSVETKSNFASNDEIVSETLFTSMVVTDESSQERNLSIRSDYLGSSESNISNPQAVKNSDYECNELSTLDADHSSIAHESLSLNIEFDVSAVDDSGVRAETAVYEGKVHNIEETRDQVDQTVTEICHEDSQADSIAGGGDFDSAGTKPGIVEDNIAALEWGTENEFELEKMTDEFKAVEEDLVDSRKLIFTEPEEVFLTDNEPIQESADENDIEPVMEVLSETESSETSESNECERVPLPEPSSILPERSVLIEPETLVKSEAVPTVPLLETDIERDPTHTAEIVLSGAIKEKNNGTPTQAMTDWAVEKMDDELRHCSSDSRSVAHKNSSINIDESVSGSSISTLCNMWDDGELHYIQSDLVEVESDTPVCDDELTSSLNDVTLTQDSMSSSSDVFNQSRETGVENETDNSTDTLKEGETGAKTLRDLMGTSEIEESDKPIQDPMNKSEISSVGSFSFVECPINDTLSDERHSPTSDKSDQFLKMDSGQTSGDDHEEIDTTTSSDIEVISSHNGEYRLERLSDASPMRQLCSVMRQPSSQSHRRTDSSSSSNHSKISEHEHSLPMKDSSGEMALKWLNERQGTCIRLIAVDERTDNLERKERAEQQQKEQVRLEETENLLKKLAETEQILRIREQKLLEMSRENVQLQESNQNLRIQLKQSQEALENDVMDLNAISQEFTARLKEAEKKLKVACQERDDYKKKFHDTENALTKSLEDSRLKQLVEEKDEQISELMAEGEKLSKQQLQSNTMIKKLRAKEQELDARCKSQLKKISQLETDVEKLTNLKRNLETMESKQSDIINSLTEAVKRLEMENEEMRTDSAKKKEQIRSLQVTLDGSYKKVHELNKAVACKDAEMQELLYQAKREAEEVMTKSREAMDVQSRDNTMALEQQIQDLQCTLSRADKDHQRMEDILRQEVADLQLRLQETEDRTQDVTQSVLNATRPLLLQIDTLKTNHVTKASAWEKMEKSLTDALYDTHQRCLQADDREKRCQEFVVDLQSRVSSLEGIISRLQAEKARSLAELETERFRAKMLEEKNQIDAEKMEIMKSSLTQQISDLKREKVLLESQLDVEKTKYENERRKAQIVSEQPIQEPEAAHMCHTPRSMSVTSDVSSVPTLPPLTQEEVLEHSLMTSSVTGLRMSLYESARQSGATNLLDHLQSQLKQKEGEIMLLQGEIAELEDTRESMAEELVSLTSSNNELEAKLFKFTKLEADHEALLARYNALLQMYGEKVEELQELQMDLKDVKDVYKLQIEELLKKR